MALLLGAVALGVGLGAVAVPPEAVVRALLGLEENPIVTELRLPRVLAGVLVGAALGVSGAAFQGLFRNPWPTPTSWAPPRGRPSPSPSSQAS